MSKPEYSQANYRRVSGGVDFIFNTLDRCWLRYEQHLLTLRTRTREMDPQYLAFLKKHKQFNNGRVDRQHVFDEYWGQEWEAPHLHWREDNDNTIFDTPVFTLRPRCDCHRGVHRNYCPPPLWHRETGVGVNWRDWHGEALIIGPYTDALWTHIVSDCALSIEAELAQAINLDNPAARTAFQPIPAWCASHCRIDYY